ncbi:MAG: hypothetical protein VB140_09415 [Burkholderia sp.]
MQQRLHDDQSPNLWTLVNSIEQALIDQKLAILKLKNHPSCDGHGKTRHEGQIF